jgi:alkaline phosphatase
MDRPKPKNVVLMVSDGMGPASLSLARSYMQYTEDVEFYKQLALDPYIVGTSRTRSHGPRPSYPNLVLSNYTIPCGSQRCVTTAYCR